MLTKKDINNYIVSLGIGAKLFTFLIICQMFCCSKLFAQDFRIDTNHYFLDGVLYSGKLKIPKYSFNVYGNIDYSSNSITSSFAGNYLLGNFIGDNLKQQVSSNLQNTNRFGYSLDYGIEGYVSNDTIGKKLFDFYFAISHKAYINATFTPDEFNLVFNGNASYPGKTAALSPSNFNNFSYQQIEIGSVCTNIFGKAELGLGISFLAAQQYQNANITQGSLYTAPNGQYLTLNSNTQFSESDTTNGTGRLINGYGASVDINFSIPYKIKKRVGYFKISVTDLGFIKWDNRSLYYNKDTSYTYSGLTINGLNSLQNATINNLSKDSLQNKYLPEKKESFYTGIPTTLNIITTMDFGKMNFEAGFRYIFNANYSGYYYLEGYKYFRHGWRIDLQMGYGGYATYNTNLSVIKFIKESAISLNINHLQGMILPAKFGGAGVYLQLDHNF